MESDCTEPLNLGSDEVISINDFAQMIIDISEKDISIENIDVPQVGVRGRNSDNTLIKEINKYKGVVTRSNFSDKFTDLNPSFNFERILKKIENE